MGSESKSADALHDELVGLLPEWGLSAATDIALLTVSENATYIARDSARTNPVILRVHRPGYHTEAEIRSELTWIDALRAVGAVESPAIVRTRSGEYIASFVDGARTRHVVGFEFMEGREPDADAALIPGFELLGEISARLHKHVETWTPPEGFTRKTWDYDSAFVDTPLWGAWHDGLGLSDEEANTLGTALAKLKTALAAYGKDKDRFGLIHADLRLANLLQRDDGLGVIDFDDCGFSWFMYDFAAAISFHELNPIVPDLQSAWLRGYQKVRALSDEDIAMLPHFILFRRILLTAWIASHAETETARAAGMATYTEGTVDLAKTYLETR